MPVLVALEYPPIAEVTMVVVLVYAWVKAADEVMVEEISLVVAVDEALIVVLTLLALAVLDVLAEVVVGGTSEMMVIRGV